MGQVESCWSPGDRGRRRSFWQSRGVADFQIDGASTGTRRRRVRAIFRRTEIHEHLTPWAAPLFASPKQLTPVRQVTLARQVAMFLARKHLGQSYPELGRAFGGRDHTTVLASVRKIEALLGKDAGMQAVISRLERALGGESP